MSTTVGEVRAAGTAAANSANLSEPECLSVRSRTRENAMSELQTVIVGLMAVMEDRMTVIVGHMIQITIRDGRGNQVVMREGHMIQIMICGDHVNQTVKSLAGNRETVQR